MEEMPLQHVRIQDAWSQSEVKCSKVSYQEGLAISKQSKFEAISPLIRDMISSDV